MICPRYESAPRAHKHNRESETAEHEKSLHRLEGAPLGPDSLLWRYMDNRLLYAGLSAGILQLMYQTIGKGVEDHSNFANEPIERVVRSMGPISETVFGTEKSAKQAGAQIVGYHHGIKGNHTDGSRYHALDPQVFADTHLTFVYAVFQVAERFDRDRLNDDQRQQLYKECITWYQNYPVTDRCLPADYDAYQQRWNELCDNEFRLDAAISKWTLNLAENGTLPKPNLVPEGLWSAMKLPLKPAGYIMGKLIVAGIPERVRINNNIQFTKEDAEIVRAFENMIKDGWGLLPQAAQYSPQSYNAFMRERARRGEPTLQDHIYSLGSIAAKNSLDTLMTFKFKLPTPPKIIDPRVVLNNFHRKRKGKLQR